MCVCVLLCVCVFVAAPACCLLPAVVLHLDLHMLLLFIFFRYGDAFVAMDWGTTRVEHFSLSCCCLFFFMYCFIVFFNCVLFVFALFCFASICLFYVWCCLCYVFLMFDWILAYIHYNTDMHALHASLHAWHACILPLQFQMVIPHSTGWSDNVLHAWYAYILPFMCLICCFYSVYVWLSWFIMMSSVAVVVLVRAVYALVVVDVLAWDNWAELLS